MFFQGWVSVGSKEVRQLVKGEPRLLFHKGDYNLKALRSERVTKEEVMQAVRNHLLGSLDMVEAVILETDGEFSVISVSAGEAKDLLSNVAE